MKVEVKIENEIVLNSEMKADNRIIKEIKINGKLYDLHIKIEEKTPKPEKKYKLGR